MRLCVLDFMTFKVTWQDLAFELTWWTFTSKSECTEHCGHVWPVTSGFAVRVCAARMEHFILCFHVLYIFILQRRKNFRTIIWIRRCTLIFLSVKGWVCWSSPLDAPIQLVTSASGLRDRQQCFMCVFCVCVCLLEVEMKAARQRGSYAPFVPVCVFCVQIRTYLYPLHVTVAVRVRSWFDGANPSRSEYEIWWMGQEREGESCCMYISCAVSHVTCWLTRKYLCMTGEDIQQCLLCRHPKWFMNQRKLLCNKHVAFTANLYL